MPKSTTSLSFPRRWPAPALSQRRAAGAALIAIAGLLLAGCMGGAKRVSYEPEEFDSTTTHTRAYPASTGQTCEAARRALLSQGYLLTAANGELVTGKKNFQPAHDVHVEVELRAVCAPSDHNARGTTVFVTAIQDRYAMKKASNSASVGVGAIGSVSLPFSQTDDSMIKVASETLTDERFYERFYALLDRFLSAVPAEDKPASAPAPAAPAQAAAAAPAPATAPAHAPVPAPTPAVAPAAAPAVIPTSAPATETAASPAS